MLPRDLITQIISFTIHFWEPVQTNLEKVSLKETQSHSVREREMEPPPPQAIETSNKDFQAGQDEQDKVVDEW